MNRPLFHFIRPFLLTALVLVPAAAAGVHLQLDAITETRAKDALVRFQAHPDTNSDINPAGTFAKAEINVRANGKQLVALETSPPDGRLTARIELVSANGFSLLDDLSIGLRSQDAQPTTMVSIENGVAVQTTGTAFSLDQAANSQIVYQPSRGLAPTADVHLQLVLTPVGLDSIEVRYDFHLVGSLTGPILRM